MKQQIKVYRMSIARVFPKKHPRAGEPTNFKHKMIIALKDCALSCECGWYGEYEELTPCAFENGYNCDGTVYVDDSRCPECNGYPQGYDEKIHTIRVLNSNSKKTWSEKISEVQEGKAVLVVYPWDGKSYSKDGNTNLFVFGRDQTEDFINELMKSDRYKCATPVIDSGLGVQKALFADELSCVSVANTEHAEVNIVSYSTIARNDGLSPEDFKAWFAEKDLSKPFEIIHFTKFRY
jgi:hypothetical protein